MTDFIKAQSAGMFAPQEKGPCKLTIIIPEQDVEAQNFAFQHLRYTDVVVGRPDEGLGGPDSAARLFAASAIIGAVNMMISDTGMKYELTGPKPAGEPVLPLEGGEDNGK